MSIDIADSQALSRRVLLSGGMALGGLMLVGCSPSDGQKAASSENISAGQALPNAQKAAMTVYRDPSCGCCEAWARIAGEAGYQVRLLDDNDMTAVKQRLGVPAELASCHTSVVDGYVVEGHVPLDQVDRLLRERPSDIKGIAVPGMPIGSPGMEAPDGRTEPYQVVAFNAERKASVYSSIS